MAEHNHLTDRELAAALAGLTPRRSSINREQLLYLAGRAAAQSDQRRGRIVTRTSMVAGWLAAAISLGLWTTRPERIVEANSTIPADSRQLANPAERPPPSLDAAPVPTVNSPVLADHDEAAPDARNSGGGRILTGYRLDSAVDLQWISRTGRLAADRPRERGSIAASETESRAPPATYRELMREFSNRADIL